MRWLLVITLTAIAALSLLAVGWAQKVQAIASDQEVGGKPREDGKSSSGAKPAEKGGEKESAKEREQRVKREIEQDEDGSVSSRYGKTIRASTVPPEHSAHATHALLSPAPTHNWSYASVLGGLGNALALARFVYSRYLAPQRLAQAATR